MPILTLVGYKQLLLVNNNNIKIHLLKYIISKIYFDFFYHSKLEIIDF